MTNLLTQPVFTLSHAGRATSRATLPGVMAALATDAVDGFPALRPFQEPSWHMALVQIAAIALHRAERPDLPPDEESWRDLLRALTTGFPDDEPWRLVVADGGKPAFFQPPLPPGTTLRNLVETPDAIDLLITAKNHDLKQAVAHDAGAEDWVFALVSVQTGDGYGGAGNYGISRMNGGSSSRPLLGLAPAGPGKLMTPRPGAWFQRDVRALLAARADGLDGIDPALFAEEDGHALLWLPPWPEGEQLRLSQLDPWYVEVCRRIRLERAGDRILARKGTSKAARVAAKDRNGVVGDPWAPVHKTENKSLTLSERDFSYRLLSDLLFSGDWVLPLLARPTAREPARTSFLLVAAALARGNSTTDGFKRRDLPLNGRIAQAMADAQGRLRLADLAKRQVEEIRMFDKALRGALALVAAGGDADTVAKEHFAHAKPAALGFDRAADGLFFRHLWDRFEAQAADREAACHAAFARDLWAAAQTQFEAALPSIPCHARFRPRAEARARRRLWGDRDLRTHFPILFDAPAGKGDPDADDANANHAEAEHADLDHADA
ncbi:CRISPR-associated protein Cse1 [Azospirillum picis]|uniref:CRISPR system Cascade subunit CasA n=1 Tax=Azospirillum picis TaxID=488438 RepID=A0ABU0MT63_9PROT|nr:CRISPR-associated protein Cse1 [Azospirillum picis]MBP2301924.1 CRISPR system Cascade subunit CasA [Azospirillum picis]MDQ0536373.1 CRISPR system Cascade subunit CasA [Azospirillum picis]